ncbi:membrane protein [Mycobacterium saskatchewanense]|uniref:MMPL/RND family transporter n=1 Tax=Mycobacterium saskatchewanense TaxID=220927 RepID=UPI00138C563F|nr:MMPL family transporter [Mycobacterium saskatchewanense]BBX64957.1 membrane protein [Mycobacterium saskatchewanense]
MSGGHAERPLAARMLRRLAVPIVLGWLVFAVVVSVFVPRLDLVERQNSVGLLPKDAPSLIAMKRMGKVFHEFDSDSVAMVVLVGDKPLGDEARRFYDDLVRRLERDTAHVEKVQNYWGELVTAGGEQSADSKAAYVQLNLAGDQGSSRADESVHSVEQIVAHSHPPPGIKAYVTGQAPLTTDLTEAGDRGLAKRTAITIAVAALMLLIAYRSIATLLIVLVVIFVELATARGIVAFIGNFHVIGFTTFAVSLLMALAIAAGTDYAIFFLGRYHEARQSGEDRETAYYTTYRGVAHVVLGSGLTIAGAMLCLRLVRLPYLNTLAIPCAVALVIVIAASLTLMPALLAIDARFGLLDAKRKTNIYRWRRLATATVRWPAPILASAVVVSIVGGLTLPGYHTNYDDRYYVPASLASNVGDRAAIQHFTHARLNPDLLLVEADHDLRNPVDMLDLDRIAASIFRVPGIARVQSITRPLGYNIEHGTIPFAIGMQPVPIRENLQYLKDRLADILRLTRDDLGVQIATLERMYTVEKELSGSISDSARVTTDTAAITDGIRDHLADFDDFWRPLRSYFYWEKHCFDVPICWSLRSVFDALDGFDKLAENFHKLAKDLQQSADATQEMVTLIPPIIDVAKSMQTTFFTLYSSFSGLITQMDRMTDTSTLMGEFFDKAKIDGLFYIAPEVFDSPDFKTGLRLLVSPDGKSTRMIITHNIDPASPEAISHVDAELKAAREAVKETPLASAKLYLGGTAATYRDIQESTKYDVMTEAIAALILIFIVMLVITRALVASMVIVGTVVLSLATGFGLSVLFWQHIYGLELHWITLPFAVTILLAVGSDYNLLLVSRFKEEIGAGLKTGIIRSVGGTGGVVTTTGLVFAFTMASLAVNELYTLKQGGTTIGLGLLIDTLIVRSLMIPSTATLLGRWFWWPLRVRSRPASELLRSVGPRPLVRALLLRG